MQDRTALKDVLLGKGLAFWRRPALRWTLGTMAGLFLLFGALGYFWLPGFAKARLEALLSEQLDRPVSIATIRVSPYALAVTVSGLSIAERAANGTGQEFVGFDSLTVNLSSASLARRVPVVSEVTLTGPRVRVARLADGSYNFSDLLEKFSAPPDQKAEPASPAPEFSVANITISGGGIRFEDQQAGAVHEVADIALGVPFIANTPGTVESYVQPSFSATVNGARLALEGKARPFGPGQDAALELDITDFDLMRLAAYLPPDLPARLQSGRLDADLVVSFDRPQGQEPKVRVGGKTTLRDVALASARGAGALRLAKAQLTLEEATLAGSVKAALALAELSVARGKEPLFGFAALDVSGVKLSQAQRTAEVAEVLLTGPTGAVRRLADGSLNAQKLVEDFTAPAKAPPAKAAPKPSDSNAPKGKKPAGITPADKKPADKPWSWSVARVGIKDGGLSFTDESLGRRPRTITASALALAVEGLRSAPGGQARLDFSTRINDHGSMAVKGGLDLAPLGADLDISLTQVDLVALQGWATRNLNAVLTRGEVSAKGRLRLAGEDASYTGELALIDLNVLDKLHASDLLRWRSLRLTGLDAGSAPLRFSATEVALGGLYARVLLTPEGTLNLQDVVRKDDGHTRPAPAQGGTPQQPQAAAPAQAPEPAQTQAQAGNQAPAPRISIGRVSLARGNIIFTDRFIRPNYTANLTDLAGHVGPLRAGAMADVAIRGKVDRTGPLEITGKMKPLDKPLNLDIRAKATGIEMSSFSPYSGRYVGYAIEKGKLSVDVRYHVEAGALKAENKVFLDQLTFGQKVDSPEAMNIPVNLVVALLANSRGEIDINLPIEGSLDDPQFSLGGIIVKVIVNLLMKAVTSPFTLLASLFGGGGEELSYVAFLPGRAEISSEAETHLQKLSKALRDRPALKLELAGHADPQAEEEGLRRASLDHRVKVQKATELARRGKSSGSVAEVVVSPEEYPRFLERVYKAADIKKPRNIVGLAKSLPPEEMEALLLQNAQVRQEDMERLAQDRGIAVQAWLVEKGGIDQARVFLLGPRVGGEAPKGVKPGGRVDFTLK